VVGANGRTVVSVVHAKPFELTINQDGYGPSDHSSFYAGRFPCSSSGPALTTTTTNLRTRPTKLTTPDEARVVALVARIVSDIDKSDKRPAYTLPGVNRRAARRAFAFISARFRIYADAKDGLYWTACVTNRRRQAGLKAGDKIVKLAGRDVRNVYDYTYALGEMKAGQE